MVELTSGCSGAPMRSLRFEYLDDEAERLKHGAICRHLGVLSPDEIRHIRKDWV